MRITIYAVNLGDISVISKQRQRYVHRNLIGDLRRSCGEIPEHKKPSLRSLLSGSIKVSVQPLYFNLIALCSLNCFFFN
ncbi:hypothetical protein HanLR1_Chr16g0603201 [Helianthus annuus]|nr:hypothetical protein HanHA89_Chr16g0642141 [Helianthus annuus]KAJ0639373.1 hypothetical protein HanLR1_Chr16g0603201 [Helianthus annuus]